MSTMQARPRRPRPAVLALALAGCVTASAAAAGERHSSKHHDFRLQTVVEGLEEPWGLAFLPDGTMLVTEKGGRLRAIRDGKLDPEPISGLPESADYGQGGLLDVLPHPDFAQNRWIYLTYAARGERGHGTRLARGRLEGKALTDVEVLLIAEPSSRGGRHFGSRLAFDREGLLYVTLGDRGNRDYPQALDNHYGKVLRLTEDGRAAEGNPYAGRADARPEIFSLGHRNQQGLARHPETGELWSVEHGPRGGDELNRLRAGVNYGWPVVTYGEEYSGGRIGRGTEFPGMAQPATYWVPSISPSGLAFYDGEAFPAWRGDLFVGALSGEHLARLRLEGERVVEQERLLEDWGKRIRDVRRGPDGLIYLLTDESSGGLYRLEPAG